MTIRTILLFLSTIVIPTTVLSFFGLRAVQSEKTVLEDHLYDKYKAMAEIVVAEIEGALKELPDELRLDPKVINPILFTRTSLFQDEVMVFDATGKAVDGIRRRADFGDPAYLGPVRGLPYKIAVYERYSVLLEKMKQAQGEVDRYFALVGLSALCLVCGGAATLRALGKEWRKARLKNEFIAELAHEIRRPLTSIQMFSEMLHTDRIPTNEQRRRYYDIIYHESERLAHFASNILDFSKIESGTMNYPSEKASMGTVVTEAVDRFKISMDGISREVVLQIDKNLPAVTMNIQMMSRAVLNLLFNAAQYSPPEAEIRVLVAREKDRVVIMVSDEGIGISPKHQKKIFKKFYRASEAMVQTQEGYGLGLALVERVVKAHHGEITVKSGEKGGSEFSITLPVG